MVVLPPSPFKYNIYSSIYIVLNLTVSLHLILIDIDTRHTHSYCIHVYWVDIVWSLSSLSPLRRSWIPGTFKFVLNLCKWYYWNCYFLLYSYMNICMIWLFPLIVGVYLRWWEYSKTDCSDLVLCLVSHDFRA